MKAMRIHSHGGPDVLAFEDVKIGQPGPNEVLVRNRAIGVNFVDTYLFSASVFTTGSAKWLRPARTGGLLSVLLLDECGPDQRPFILSTATAPTVM